MTVTNMGEHKVQWFVSLFGSENELKRLHSFLDSANCCLKQLEETDDRYFLTSCRFSNLEDAKEVCDLAKKLVVMIRAFAKLELGGDFQSIHIGSGKIVVDTKNVASIVQRVDGSQSVWVYPMTVGATATVLPVRVSGAELVEPPEREKRIHDDYLNRCDEEIDSNVFDVLYYFAEETTFYSLYKVYETIKIDTDNHQQIDHNCKMVDDGWVKYDDLNAFKKSANCYGVVRSPAGKYSLRHSQAECRQGKVYKGPIYNLGQAEGFIRHLFERWFSWKN